MEDARVEESKQILMAITELKANVSNMSEQIKELSKIGTTVIETSESVKVAHNRINDLKTDLQKEIANEVKLREKLDGHITWLWRAFAVGAIGWLFQFFKGGGTP